MRQHGRADLRQLEKVVLERCRRLCDGHAVLQVLRLVRAVLTEEPLCTGVPVNRLSPCIARRSLGSQAAAHVLALVVSITTKWEAFADVCFQILQEPSRTVELKRQLQDSCENMA